MPTFDFTKPKQKTQGPKFDFTGKSKEKQKLKFDFTGESKEKQRPKFDFMPKFAPIDPEVFKHMKAARDIGGGGIEAVQQKPQIRTLPAHKVAQIPPVSNVAQTEMPVPYISQSFADAAEQHKADVRLKKQSVPAHKIQVSPASKAAQTEMPLPKRAWRSLLAGGGDVISTAGGAAQYLGMDEAGQKLQQLGEERSKAWEVPYEGKPGFHPLDPEWLATKGARSIPFMLSLIPAMAAGGLGAAGIAGRAGAGALGQAIAGGIGGTAASRPLESLMEAGGVYNEAKTRGMNDEQAEKVASEVFVKNTGLALTDVAQMLTAFAPAPFKASGKAMKLATGAGRLGLTAATEAGEEGIQDYIQKKALGDKFSLSDPSTQEAMGIGALFGGGMGAAGVVVDTLRTSVKKNMPEEQRTGFDDAVKDRVNKGTPEPQAILAVLNDISSTPGGRQLIEKATQDAVEIFNQQAKSESYRMPTKKVPREFDKTPIPEKGIDIVDTKYESQYNTDKEIRNQLRKYYSGFDGEEGLDEAAGAIKDLRKTENNIQSSGREGQGNTDRGNGLRSGSNDNRRAAGRGIQTETIGNKPYKTVGLSFSKDLIDKGKVNLTGHKIGNTDDLAVISQVFRDPRFETFRVIYTKGDQIVGTDAISSRIPSASVAFLDSKPKYLNRTKIRMKRLGADGYYLLHNHPTGYPKPSPEDVKVTGVYAQELPGFKEHIIINSNKYSKIFADNSTGGLRLHGKENLPLNLGEDRLLKASIGHPLLFHKISSPSELAALAKAAQTNKGIITAFFANAKMEIKGIQEIDKKMLGDKNFRNFLRNQAREHGGTSTFIVGDSSIEDALKNLIFNGDLTDAYLTDTKAALRNYITPSKTNSRDWMGLGVGQEGKGLRPPKPFEDTTYRIPEFKPKEEIPGPPLLLPEPEGVFRDLPESITRKMPNVPTAGGVVSRKVMIDRLLKQLDVPSRVGRISQRNALGIFKVKPEVIRTRLAEDMPVISHEVGHYLDKMFGIRDAVSNDQTIVEELTALGKTQPKKWFTEGIAEFMRRYLTGEEVKQLAPEFNKWFENAVSKESKIWDALSRFRQDYIDYTKAPAAARVKAAISTKEKGKRKVTVDRIMQAAVDDLRPIDSYVQKVTGGGKERAKVKTTEDPFVQAWLFRGWMGKARNALHYSVMDANGKKIGPSFREITRPVANRIDDFRAYIVAKRAAELHSRGINPGIELEDAVKTVEQFDSAEFKKAHEELKQFQDNILNRLVESGVLSSDQAAAMRQLNQEYVPFYRVFDESAAGVGFGKRGFADLHNPIKGIKGSGRTIVDPLESIVKNTYYLTRIAEQNNVGRTLVDFAQKYEGMGKFIEKVPPKMHPVEFSLGEIEKALKEIGVELPDEALSELTKIFRPQMMGSAKDNIVAVFRKGKQELYQLDPDLYRSVLMLDREAVNTFIKLLSYPTSWLRAGAVLTPEFMVRNPLRDAKGAWVYSKYWFVPGVDTARGLFHVLKRDDLYQKWLQSGGAMANFVSLDRDYLQQDLRQLMATDIWQRMKQYAAHPLEVLRALSEFTEEATRLGEFAKGVQKEGVTKEGLQKAGLASRDITVDFSRMGTVGKPANQLIAFFNSNVQGMDKMRREFMQGSKKKRLKVLFKAFLGITLPSIALWIMFHDDPRYQELPRWRKDLFWNIPGGEYMISIPKPFELGILFGTLPERMLDWVLENDPDAIAKFKETFTEVSMPGWIPTALLPIIETTSNYSFFKNRPITPRGEEQLLKQEQYGPYTTEAAKGVSKVLAGEGEAPVSPREIETLVRGYTGGLGMYGLKGLSAFMPEEAPKPAEDFWSEKMPGVRGVLNEPYRGSASIDDFYKRLEELEKKAKTAKKYQKIGKPVSKSLQYNTYELKQMQKVQRNLADLRKQRGDIIKSKNMTAEQKKEAINRIDMQMINVARQMLGEKVISQ